MYFLHLKQHCLHVCLQHIRGSAVAAINCWGETSNYKHKHLCSLSPLSHFTPVKQLNLMILWATLALWSVSFCANILKLQSTSTFKTNKRHLLKGFQKYLWLNTVKHFCALWLPNIASMHAWFEQDNGGNITSYHRHRPGPMIHWAIKAIYQKVCQ